MQNIVTTLCTKGIVLVCLIQQEYFTNYYTQWHSQCVSNGGVYIAHAIEITINGVADKS